MLRLPNVLMKVSHRTFIGTHVMASSRFLPCVINCKVAYESSICLAGWDLAAKVTLVT